MRLSVRFRQALCGLLGVLSFGVCQNAHATFSLTFQGLVQTLNTGGSISLSSPAGIFVDASGDTFVVDTGNNRIVEVNAQGTASVWTITGLSPSLSSPSAITSGSGGVLYIADTGNNRIVQISSAGAGVVISTGSVTLSSPRGVALDQSGDLFIADTGNNRIVEVTSGGSAAVLTITVSSGSSTLSSPKGLWVNPSGTLYVADSGNNRIVKVASGSTTGVVQSILGGVTLSNPSAVVTDNIGNVYIADTGNSRIAEVDTSSNGTVLYTDSVTFSAPLAMSVDPFGTVYVADTGNSRGVIVDPPVNGDLTPSSQTYSLNQSVVGFGHVQLGSVNAVTLTLPFTTGSVGLGAVKVFAFGTQNLDFTNGPSTTCNSSTPSSTACSVQISFLPTGPGLRKGAVVLYDTSQNPILTIPLYGYADTPVAALSPGTAAVISTGSQVTSNPYQVVLDGSGNMYVGDYTGKNVVKIPAGGGSASLVSLGTPASIAVQNITGAALDGAGNLFIGDHQNSRILVMTPGGVVSVLSITGLSPSLGFPTALAFDAAQNLYIADFTNGRIVKISSLVVGGTTSSGLATVIGTGSYSFTGSTLTGLTVDGKGTIYAAARTQNSSSIIKITRFGVVSALSIPSNITPAISNPQGVTVDANGNIYIVDTANSRIVEITTAGVASVIGITGLTGPATLSTLVFGTTVDAYGNLYISDWTNNRIVFVNVSGSVLTFASTNVGATSSDSPKTTTVTNLGNQSLLISANPTYTANFINNSGDTNPCTSSTSLSAGIACDVSVKFTPQASGSLTAGIMVTDNTLNIPSSTQQVSVSGTGIVTADTTSTAVTVTPTSVTNGQTVSITATVSDTTTGHTATIPTGQLSFTDTVGTTTITLTGSPATLSSSGVATLTGVQLTGSGTHTIAANYAGVSNSFQASTNSTTVALTKASVTVAGPTVQPVMVTLGQAASAVVTVTGSANLAAPSGTLSYTFLNTSMTAVATGTPALTAATSGSTASIPIPSTLSSGAYTINVTYAGDSNYLAASTPTVIQVSVGQIAPTISWSPAATSIAYGASLNGILDATATNGGTALPGTFVYTAALAGGGATVVNSATVLSAGSYTLTATFTPTDNTTYAVGIKTVSLSVGQITPTISWNPAASIIIYGTSLSGILNAAATNGTTTIPGNFTYTATPAGGTAATVTSASVLAAGSYTLTATFTPTDTTSYASVTKTASLTVGQATPTLSWTPATSALTYSVSLSGILNATATNGTATIPGTFTYTATLSGGSTVPVTSATVLSPGSYTLTATFTPTDTTTYSSATKTAALTVSQVTPTIVLGSSLNPVLVTSAVTFTAGVSSSSGSPTGTISFFDSTALLGTVALSQSAASFTTSGLSVGTHSITAVYSGDTNFATVTSTAVAQGVQDFSLGSSGGSGPGSGSGSTPTQTVVPGGTATYTLALGPVSGVVFPVPVTLSVSGVPPGATATVSPQVVPAGSPLTNVTLSVQLPSVASLHPTDKPSSNHRIPTAAWGVLLLPFLGRLRRSGRRMRQMFSLFFACAAALAVTAGLSGCGSNSSGFFANPQHTYSVVVTATAGTVSRSTTVTLIVQ